MTNEERAYKRIKDAVRRGRVSVQLFDLTGVRLTMTLYTHKTSRNITWPVLELAHCDPIAEAETNMEHEVKAMRIQR